MSEIQVIGHSSFLGETGFNEHSQNLFIQLNKYFSTRVRNFSYDSDLTKYSKETLDIIIESKWKDPPHKIGTPLTSKPNEQIVNLVLNEVNHHYFWDDYASPLIFYTTWETTKKPQEFFDRLLIADQIWVPSTWEKNCMCSQGCPENKIKVVREGINPSLYHSIPASQKQQIRNKLHNEYNIPLDAFTFLVFGRWDFRKSITEIIKCFNEEFKNDQNVYLILSADNPFSSDGMSSTEERLKHYNLKNERIKVLHFPKKEEYIQWLQTGHCYLSCSRSEGWGLPLIQALACAVPAIASQCSGQMEFAYGLKNLIPVKETKANNLFGYRKPNIDIGNFYEPDFDYLKKTMRSVVNNYDKNLIAAKKYSNYIKKEFTWNKASIKAKQHIEELAFKYKNVKQSIIKKKFNTTFESVGGKPKVTFNSSVTFNEKILARIKDLNGNVQYSSSFDDLKKGINYWISSDNQVSEIVFEILDSKGLSLYSENLSQIELYQDQYVNGTVIMKGKRDCHSRYEAMKTVFEKYNRPFTILDIGANFGYYSIRAAAEFDAVSVMIENKTGESDKLLELCNKNNCSHKLIVLKDTMNLHKLKELTKCEHFDVVLALNVIHHFDEDITEVCKAMTELGDNLILETPPVDDKGSCGQKNLQDILDYFEDAEKENLGGFQRHTSNTKSNIFWIKTPKTELKWPYYDYENLFSRTDIDTKTLKERGSNKITSNFDSKTISSPRRKEEVKWISGINLKTFLKLNGIYPNKNDLIQRLKTKNIQGNYKWDNTNNDLVLHNFILNGHEIHMIDYDDKLIEKTTLSDDEQLNKVLDEIDTDKTKELDGIKLNLGCGNDIKSGYINIDRYNNTKKVDIKSDISTLPFKTESVIELYTSHVFEHITIEDMYKVLSEWRRVLKIGGKLVLRLPDLETEVKLWLNASDDNKWSEVHRIFGSQTHEGNTHFCGFNIGSLQSFLERFNFKIESNKLGNRGHGTEIQCTAIKINDKKIPDPTYICHFVNNPHVEIKGDPKDKAYYQVDFLDPENNSSVHQTTLKINTWTKASRQYYTDWLVKIRRNGELKFQHKFDLKGKNVLISFDSRSMGDTISWMPYVEEFRKKHSCNVTLATFWNKLFHGHDTYKNIKFIDPGTVVHNLYAAYNVGCYDNNLLKNVSNWRTTPLQKIASDILGLDYKEIIPDIAIKHGSRKIREKYVTLSEFSTLQSKFWNYDNGWQEIVDYFNNMGWRVAVISKEETKLKNVINRTGRPIDDTISTIYHGEMHLGVSAGPSWLSWALRKPVILISGYSQDWSEFNTNVERIINKDVCHGCFNSLNNTFNRGDFWWCPNHQRTPRQFECTREITPDIVKKSIQKIINQV